MTVHPILAALRKHKSGVVLIALQIALTLAIVCNAVFIIANRIDRVNRPTGLDESNLFLVSQQWVGAPNGIDQASIDKIDSLMQQDIATLRQIPGVASVTPINSLPLVQSAWNSAISTKPSIQFQDKTSYNMTTFYFVDEHGLSTLGVKLVAGRNFKPSEIIHNAARSKIDPAVVILSRALADRLYPDGDALGKVVYIGGQGSPSTVIGIVARLQTPSLGDWADAFAYSSTLVPRRLDGGFSRYAVRTQPGQLNAVMQAAGPALYKVNPMRVLDDKYSIRSFGEIRAEAYKGDVGMAILMGVICLILIAITAAGIVGLTSFWVGQRRKQIGVRRALGARKADILRYFQIENLLIASGGAVLGIVLAVGLNLWLMRHMAMDRLPIPAVLAGVVLVLALGQLAVFVPARRAAAVPPVVATRSV
ncbi:MAG TPA: FtsX-like permease family protein [Rhodanobacteraceae bacterium]|nr:FtsX-like permease family protein [Rhodanobacteraceae bacterium]